jgi:hypothetical protein
MSSDARDAQLHETVSHTRVERDDAAILYFGMDDGGPLKTCCSLSSDRAT